jgi:replicative DNA helicase
MVMFLHKPPDGIVDTVYTTVTDEAGNAKRKKSVVEREWPAELILAKNRNGETGTIRLEWEAQYTRFSCWDKPQNMDNYEPAFDTPTEF